MKMYVVIPIILLMVLLLGCSQIRSQIMDGDGMVNNYHQISQEEAKKMMGYVDGHIIVDVRRQDEYDEGHIPGAICIPNESIETTQPPELPDLNQTILVYCRSGRRSKEAAQKLFDMGYTGVYEFGGIIDWTGEIVKESTVSKESGPVTESEDFSMDPIAIPSISIGDKHFTLYFDSNSSAEEFFEKIKKEHLVITMKDQGGVEKVGELPWTLTANDEAVTASPGDILLYQGNRLSICYSESSTNSTKIGHIPYYDDFGDFSEVLGKGDTTVDFTVVWTE